MRPPILPRELLIVKFNGSLNVLYNSRLLALKQHCMLVVPRLNKGERIEIYTSIHRVGKHDLKCSP